MKKSHSSIRVTNHMFYYHYVLVFVILSAHLISAEAKECSDKCHQQATCASFENTEEVCCKCNNGFIGNGVNCFEKDESIVIRGKVSGTLNGVQLEDQEMNAYVHTLATDARNYVTLGRIPLEIGNRATLVLPFAAPVHWLFAGDMANTALNGFALTGGVFSRTSDASYLNEEGQVIGNLYVRQNFTGLSETGRELSVTTVIEGRLPELAADEQVIYLDYNQDFDLKPVEENPNTRKEVESKGSVHYKVTMIRTPDTFKSFRIEHSERIHFDVCASSHADQLSTHSAKTKLSTKRLFVTYTDSEGQVRFSSANFVRPNTDSQPANACEQQNQCHIFSECVLDAESEQGYYCQCKPGFDGDGSSCVDINECDEGTTYCSPNARCLNLLGHYECKCEPPRVGDGRVCEWDQSANAYQVCARCDANARCITDDSGQDAYCRCNQGFVGNGNECQPDPYAPEPQPDSENFPTTRPTTTTTTVFTTTRKRLEHTDKCEDCSLFATCELQHETSGECCVCLEGYIGNGKYCVQESTPILITGKISGTLNGHRLDDLELYSYVLTHSSDSRNFVAINKVPPNLGGSFQVLINVITPINWLFAGKNGIDSELKISNGFSNTGGLFTRTSTLTFFDEFSRQSHSVRIRQQFLGLDPNGKEIIAHTEIDGTLPTVDPDAQVVFKDYKQEYTHDALGSIGSSGEIAYEITSISNSQAFTSYKLAFKDEIVFSECPHAVINPTSSTVRVSSKRVYVKYTKGDNLVRFNSANYLYPKDGHDDPCEMNTCSIYAECIVDPEARNNYTCACKVGFQGDGFNCYDDNECESGEADCDANAICYNLVGHYECQCRAPYKGNGKECFYDIDCRSCHSNAHCVESDGKRKCVCNDGYAGDGLSCTPITSECQCPENSYCIINYQLNRQECRCKPGFTEDINRRCLPLPCNEYLNCNENARCELTSKGTYECKCLQGFFGDGFICATKTCDILNNCHENAKCIPDSMTLQFRCVCLNGYIGNGYDCIKDVQSCNVQKNCHPYAECLHEERTNRHFCKCKPGFTGDGFQCSPINSCRDKAPYEVCDVNADCVYDTKVNEYVCKCRSGYEGNGLRSKCFLDDSFGLFLVYAQGSSLHKIAFRDTSDTLVGESGPSNVGVHKNRIVYIPGQTAVGVSYDCHEKFIYWSDVSGNVINRIRLDGTNYSVVLSNVKSAEGIAVDPISRNLYFTDSETRTIEVASLNGKFRKVLIKSHLSNPRGIAIDPVDGYIFWTDWNRKAPKIERANMDGTHRRVIVHDDLGVPNGLYFDPKRQEVCWGDAKTKKIECVEKDGSNRRLVTHMTSMYPFDLTEIRSNIYWSDWSRKEIQNVDKDGVLGQPIKLSLGGNGRVYGITAVRNACPRGTNRCDRTNGDCEQLCLPRPDHTRQCACSDDSNGECHKTISVT